MSPQFYQLDPPLESCLLEFTCQKLQLYVKTLRADTSIVIFTILVEWRVPQILSERDA